MRAPFSSERTAAFEQLLAQPDRRDLKALNGRRRGHRLICVGTRDRFQRTWQPAARRWLEERMAASVGVIDGWKPGMRTLTFPPARHRDTAADRREVTRWQTKRGTNRRRPAEGTASPQGDGDSRPADATEEAPAEQSASE